MKSEVSTNNVTVQLQGVSAKAEIGRVAAKGVSRIGKEPRKKCDCEVLCRLEFSSVAHLMQKEWIFDRKNDRYKELVINIDTGEIVRNVDESLSEHVPQNKKNKQLLKSLKLFN